MPRRNLKPTLGFALSACLLLSMFQTASAAPSQPTSTRREKPVWSCLKRKDLLRDSQDRAIWLTSKVLMERAIETHPIERPESLGRNRLSGTVDIEVVIDGDGRIVCMRRRNGHPIAAAAAMRSLRRWKFKPYSIGLEKKSIAGVLTIPYDFAS